MHQDLDPDVARLDPLVGMTVSVDMASWRTGPASMPLPSGLQAVTTREGTVL